MAANVSWSRRITPILEAGGGLGALFGHFAAIGGKVAESAEFREKCGISCFLHFGASGPRPRRRSDRDYAAAVRSAGGPLRRSPLPARAPPPSPAENLSRGRVPPPHSNNSRRGLLIYYINSLFFWARFARPESCFMSSNVSVWLCFGILPDPFWAKVGAIFGSILFKSGPGFGPF